MRETKPKGEDPSACASIFESVRAGATKNAPDLLPALHHHPITSLLPLDLGASYAHVGTWYKQRLMAPGLCSGAAFVSCAADAGRLWDAACYPVHHRNDMKVNATPLLTPRQRGRLYPPKTYSILYAALGSTALHPATGGVYDVLHLEGSSPILLSSSLGHSWGGPPLTRWCRWLAQAMDVHRFLSFFPEELEDVTRFFFRRESPRLCP
jgi:hypothetical protein